MARSYHDPPGHNYNPGKPTAMAPTHAKALYNLIDQLPTDAFKTNALHASKPKKEHVLVGLRAEFMQPISLDELAYPETAYKSGPYARRAHLEDLLIDREQEEMLNQIEIKEVIFQLLSELAERKYAWFEVIMFRYGFWDGSRWTLQAIAEQMDCTREYVRQLEERAIKELGNIILEWSVIHEIQVTGVVSKRPEHRVATPPSRGRHAVVVIKKPSELDSRSYMTLNYAAKVLGTTGTLLQRWLDHYSDFPSPIIRDGQKLFLLSQIVKWAYDKDRIAFER